MPTNHVPVLDALLGAIRVILRRLIPAEAREQLRDPKMRAKLVLAADALLLAEVPQSRLVPTAIRHALIKRILNELLSAGGALESLRVDQRAIISHLESIGVDTGTAVPDEREFFSMGVRGFTVQLKPEIPQEKADQIINACVPNGTVEPFPRLPNTYSIRLPEREKPLTSEAWQLARDLEATGNFVYAEPNFAIPAVSDRVTRTALEGLGGTEWDRDHPSTRSNYEWSLERIKIKAYWAKPNASKGEHVKIGHIDTGYTLHPEIKDNLLPALGFDYWEDEKDPVDPLDESLIDRLTAFPILNPGHGTGTSSVIASPVGKDRTTAGVAWVSGTAPAAKIIPFRATPSVVIVPCGSQDEVARAIVGATDADVNVISMSLGSPWGSTVLEQAIEYALSKGVIVCAAAGNVVAEVIQSDHVTYPAKYPGVVAVAACDFDYKPWVRSCRGSEVVITAPGTDVWRAVATNDVAHAEAQRGSGTSFAVATVAGVAACWIARHGGAAALRAHYDQRPRLVPAAFLLALQTHAKVPIVDAPQQFFGGGVVDVEALMSLPLPNKQQVEQSLKLARQPRRAIEALENISPFDATSQSIAERFHSWTGLRDLDELGMKEFSMLVATQPQLLAAWWQAFGVAAPGLALESLVATAPPDRVLGSTAKLGLSVALQNELGGCDDEDRRDALETARVFR